MKVTPDQTRFTTKGPHTHREYITIKGPTMSKLKSQIQTRLKTVDLPDSFVQSFERRHFPSNMCSKLFLLAVFALVNL